MGAQPGCIHLSCSDDYVRKGPHRFERSESYATKVRNVSRLGNFHMSMTQVTDAGFSNIES